MSAKRHRGIPHWTADEAAWANFIAWAALYGCTEDNVLDALEIAAQAPVMVPGDWTGTKTGAMGAVIARVTDYNAPRIEKYAIKGLSDAAPLSADTQAAVRGAAKSIAVIYHESLKQSTGEGK